MSTKRKAVLIVDDTEAFTFLKPFSGEYKEQLIVLHEDAFGEMNMKIMTHYDIMRLYSIPNKEFNEILDQLT